MNLKELISSVLHCAHLPPQMWQSQVEIKHYSLSIFDHFFDVYVFVAMS